MTGSTSASLSRSAFSHQRKMHATVFSPAVVWHPPDGHSSPFFLPPPLPRLYLLTRHRCSVACAFLGRETHRLRGRRRRFGVRPRSLKPRYHRLITRYRTPFLPTSHFSHPPVFLLVPVASMYFLFSAQS